MINIPKEMMDEIGWKKRHIWVMFETPDKTPIQMRESFVRYMRLSQIEEEIEKLKGDMYGLDFKDDKELDQV